MYKSATNAQVFNNNFVESEICNYFKFAFTTTLPRI